MFQLDKRQAEAAVEQAKKPRASPCGSGTSADRCSSYDAVLVAQKAVSQAELDKALSAESAGKAGMDANQAVLDNAMLNLGWTTVVAPISGIAGISKCQIGDLMTPITAADNHIQRELIYVDINIAEQNYIRFVREKQAARQPKI